jgi:hypothetical protein
MMEDLPLDTNHPAVRDYLALIRHVSGCSPSTEQTELIRLVCRLQVLTPLSLLVNITAVLVCSMAVTPGIRTSCAWLSADEIDSVFLHTEDIEKMFPSSISPNPLLIATYLLLVYVGQVGYCILLVMARKPETKVRNHRRLPLTSQLTSAAENHD